MPRTTIRQRWSDIALNRTGMRAPAISRRLGIPQRAVWWRLKSTCRQANDVKDLPRSGRPCKGMCQQWLQLGLSWNLRRPTAQKYTDHILGHHVEPHIDNHVLADSVVFMQECASAHAARISEGFFANAVIDVLLWPTKGPDINIIENIWSYLSRRINGMDPLHRNAAELRAAVHCEWQSVPHARIRRLVTSVARRFVPSWRLQMDISIINE